jgi:hypothetical protein
MWGRDVVRSEPQQCRPTPHYVYMIKKFVRKRKLGNASFRNIIGRDFQGHGCSYAEKELIPCWLPLGDESFPG